MGWGSEVLGNFNKQGVKINRGGQNKWGVGIPRKRRSKRFKVEHKG